MLKMSPPCVPLHLTLRMHITFLPSDETPSCLLSKDLSVGNPIRRECFNKIRQSGWGPRLRVEVFHGLPIYRMSTLWFLAGHTINAWSGLGPPNEGYASCLTALLFAWFKPGLCVETWSKFWFCAIQSSQFMAAMSQVWKDDSGVPTVRYAAAAAVLGNKILVMGGYHARDSETWQCWSAALASVASKLDSLKREAKKGSCEKRKSLAVHVGHAKAMQDRFLFRLLIGEEKSPGIYVTCKTCHEVVDCKIWSWFSMNFSWCTVCTKEPQH